MPLTANPAARNQIKLAGLLLVTGIVAYLCYRILLPFFPALTWAIALAVVAQPLHRVLERRLKSRTASSLLAVVIITIVLVLPLALMAERVVSEAVSAVRTVSAPDFRVKINAALASHPKLVQAFDWLQQRVNLSEHAQSAAASVGAIIPAAFAGSLAGLVQLFVALFTVFFLLRDFEVFVAAVRSLIPLSKADADEVLIRVQQTIDASIRGRIVIAAIQGFFGGLIFWILGLSAPLLWGCVMTMFAMVPMLGAFIVWVPAVVYLLLTGHVVKAIILTAWGILVIGVADNFLYPVLVGKGMRLHTVVIFFAVLGGVAAFGASGLVMGPVIFAVMDALINIWTRRESREGVADA